MYAYRPAGKSSGTQFSLVCHCTLGLPGTTEILGVPVGQQERNHRAYMHVLVLPGTTGVQGVPVGQQERNPITFMCVHVAGAVPGVLGGYGNWVWYLTGTVQLWLL